MDDNGVRVTPRDWKRLAEVDIPIAVVSKHAARQKSIRRAPLQATIGRVTTDRSPLRPQQLLAELLFRPGRMELLPMTG